jgi:hypothetical protein
MCFIDFMAYDYATLRPAAALFQARAPRVGWARVGVTRPTVASREVRRTRWMGTVSKRGSEGSVR